jgi:hypothetical protein
MMTPERWRQISELYRAMCARDRTEVRNSSTTAAVATWSFGKRSNLSWRVRITLPSRIVFSLSSPGSILFVNEATVYIDVDRRGTGREQTDRKL